MSNQREELGDFKIPSEIRKKVQQNSLPQYQNKYLKIIQKFLLLSFLWSSDCSYSSYFINRRLSWWLFCSTSITVYWVSETYITFVLVYELPDCKGPSSNLPKKKTQHLVQPQFLCRWNNLKEFDYLMWKEYGLHVGSRHPWRVARGTH